MSAAKETIKIKTATGKVQIERTDKKAIIKEERTGFGYKEESVTTITKLNELCIHYVFGPEKNIIETLKSH